MRDLARQRELAKKAAVLLGVAQILYRREDGSFAFVSDGEQYNGEIVEIVTQY